LFILFCLSFFAFGSGLATPCDALAHYGCSSWDLHSDGSPNRKACNEENPGHMYWTAAPGISSINSRSFSLSFSFYFVLSFFSQSSLEDGNRYLEELVGEEGCQSPRLSQSTKSLVIS